MVEELNSGPPNCNTSALKYSATLLFWFYISVNFNINRALSNWRFFSIGRKTVVPEGKLCGKAKANDKLLVVSHYWTKAFPLQIYITYIYSTLFDRTLSLCSSYRAIMLLSCRTMVAILSNGFLTTWRNFTLAPVVSSKRWTSSTAFLLFIAYAAALPALSPMICW